VLRLVVVVLICALGSLHAAEPAVFGPKVEAILNAPEFKRASWGLLVVDAKTGDTLYEKHPDQFFAPASVTKLFSTAAALSTFGANFAFDTPVFARGRISKSGVLNGDLILVASGDLSFGGRNQKDSTELAFENYDHTYANSGLAECKVTKTNPLFGLNDLAKQIKESGITEVTGEVLIDDRLFAQTRSSGSGPDVLTPMTINDNVIDAVIIPAEKKGDKAKVELNPASLAFALDAEVSTAESGSIPVLNLTMAGQGQYVLRGSVPAGAKPIVRIIPVDDPTTWARSLFIEALRRAGVRVQAPLLRPQVVNLPDNKDYAELKRVGLFTSATLGEHLKVTLKVSHNLYATALPCLVAAKNRKSTADEGLRLQRQLLKDLGVEPDSMSFGSGAGGSGADFVTPRATIQLLQGLAKRDDWKDYRSWLPNLGVDGTLAESVPSNSPAKGSTQAKTGTNVWPDAMNNRALLRSKSLAGAMTMASGREVYFAVFVNNVPLKGEMTASTVGKTLGKVCEAIHADR